MATTPGNKQITLRPSWKQFFWGYLLAAVTTPLLGLGLIIFYLLNRKQKETWYLFTDTGISAVDSKYRQNIDLLNIEEITLRQTRLQEVLEIGTLRITTPGSEMEIVGVDRPSELKEMIESSVAFLKEQKRQRAVRERPEPKYKPGSIDKMDYLTGLWQQGLLSDDDYKEEKKNFE